MDHFTDVHGFLLPKIVGIPRIVKCEVTSKIMQNLYEDPTDIHPHCGEKQPESLLPVTGIITPASCRD